MKIYKIAIILSLPFFLNGQCFPDRHNTTWFDAWISCEKSANPNSNLPESHWIMYDLGQAYKLMSSHFWNINDPSHLNMGMSKVLVEYSLDAIEWDVLDTVYLDAGTGRSIYEGVQGPDFGGADAQYVLITGLESHGSDECMGFAEIRVERQGIVTSSNEDLEALNSCFEVGIYPNPFQTTSVINVASDCEGEIELELSNIMGSPILRWEVESKRTGTSLDLSGNDLSPVHHILRVRQGENVAAYKLTKSK